MPIYDPYKIRIYSRRNFWTGLAISTTLVIPIMIQGLVPEYKGPFRGQKEFQDRTVIVTGATGNLGASICLQYALRKFRVIMACRDIDACKILRREIVLASRNNSISCRHLDLEDIESINSFADDMIKKEPHINVLVNNAAITYLENKQLTKYGIEKMYFVNFLAPFLLTFRLLDKLEEAADYAGDSRIINVIGKPKKNWKVAIGDINFEKRKYTSDAAYRQSKLALAYFTILLERYNRNKGNNVYVYGTSPCFKSIRNSVDHRTGLSSHIIGAKQLFHTISAVQASSTTAYCGIEKESANRSYSGQLYTYLMRSWGWGKADKDDNEAKAVWNHAYKLLLDIPGNSKENDPKSSQESSDQVERPNGVAINKVD